jgi:hypothetical protein
VVVLGTGRHAAPGPARASEWTDADRFFAGIEAYQHLRTQGFRPRLIFTGGWWPTQPHLRPEGDELRLRAIALGLPPADLLSTARVRNTAEEARAQLELELAAEHDIISGGLTRAIEIGVVDEVLEPDRTRTTVARALLDTPGVRGAHGNIPL